jgi:hypothetical protein
MESQVTGQEADDLRQRDTCMLAGDEAVTSLYTGSTVAD